MRWIIWSEDQDEEDAVPLDLTNLYGLDMVVHDHVEADYEKDCWDFCGSKEFTVKNLDTGEIKKVHGSTEVRTVVNARFVEAPT